MQILFLSDNFPPEVNAPASRTFEHCREWVRAGHEVTVITCAPNFPQGRVFKGYRNELCSTEVMDGIRVVRVWSYMTANVGFVKRTLDYVSYMAMAVAASPFVPRPDVIVCTSPQFFTACAGYAVSRLRGRPYVFELRDLWPESIRAVGAIRNELVFRLLEKLEMFLYRRAAAVVCVTRSFKENLVSRGIAPEKVTVVTNGADLSRYSPSAKDAVLSLEHDLQGKFIAGYVGTHGMAHALETLLEAAAILQAREEGGDIRFVLLGDGASKPALKRQAADLGLRNLIFLDTVPKDQVSRYWSVLDVSIIHLRNTELFTTVIPSKLFECMAMGIPVLHGVAGESAGIVEDEGVGVVFEAENPEALVEELLALSRDSVRCGLLRSAGPAAATKYDRRALAGRMLSILETVAASRTQRSRNGGELTCES